MIKQSKLLKIKSKILSNLFIEKYTLKLGEFHNTTGTRRVKVRLFISTSWSWHCFDFNQTGVLSLIIGLCNDFNLDASKSVGGGGRKLSFRWSVRWAAEVDEASLTSLQKAAMRALNSTFNSFPVFKPVVTVSTTLVGLKYEFAVTVINFLGYSSAESKVVVERQNKALPSVRVGSKVRKIKAGRDTILKG